MDEFDVLKEIFRLLRSLGEDEKRYVLSRLIKELERERKALPPGGLND